MRSKCWLAMSILVVSACIHETNILSSELEGWKVSDFPQQGSPRWDRITESMQEWEVVIENEQVKARLLDSHTGDDERGKLPFTLVEGRAVDGLAGTVYVTEVEGGWLVGFDAGEFGAGLWWYSSDGKSREFISDDQVCGFVDTSFGLLAPEGLSHMGISEGRVIRLSQADDGKWHSEEFASLPSAPFAAVRDLDGSMIVATDSALMRVTLDKTTIPVFDSVPMIYPNSVAIDGARTIYVGMRGGVARFVKGDSQYEMKWLTPAS